jgi:hypothetical protein
MQTFVTVYNGKGMRVIRGCSQVELYSIHEKTRGTVVFGGTVV